MPCGSYHKNFKSSRFLILATLGLLFSGFPSVFASQSLIEQRTSYNSEEQLTYFLSGTWGVTEKSFLTGSFTHSRTPLNALGQLDTFYQGTIGMGYAIDNVGFDLGFQASHMPIPVITSMGGTIGITYIHVPEDSEPEAHSDHALGLLRSQIYTKNEEQPPQFWIRAAYLGTSMKSAILPESNNSGKETAFTLDGYYPLNDEFLFGAGLAFYTYHDEKGFFSSALKNATNVNLFLLGATLQGLPRSSASFQMTWQLAPRDALMPRYQATEVETTRHWSHTIDVGWRHQFGKSWFMTPTHEITVQDERIFTGFLFNLAFIF